MPLWYQDTGVRATVVSRYRSQRNMPLWYQDTGGRETFPCGTKQDWGQLH